MFSICCWVITAEYHELFGDAVKSLEAQGGRRQDIDFSPFAATAKLLYESAFLAERYSGIKTFLEQDEVLSCWLELVLV